MEQLLVLDEKNYTDDMPVYERECVRAIIVKNGRIAVQRNPEGWYKLPGGGVESGEDYYTALYREVKEETGLCIKKDTAVELGEILELREDIKKAGQKYICHSYFYECEITSELCETSMTEHEIMQGYVPCFASVGEILKKNGIYQPKARDTKFMEMVRDGKIKL